MSGRRKKWLDTAFVAHRMEMRLSAAWRAIPPPLWRILDRLEVEHMRHAGSKNGELFVSFGQFVDVGVSRRNILSLLRLGEALGFVQTIRSTEVQGDIRNPNQYRLTYFPKGSAAPTDEWKSVTEERAQRALDNYRAADKQRAEATSAKKAAAA